MPGRGAVLVEVGGGGLSLGRLGRDQAAQRHHVRVVGVEPEGAPKMKRRSKPASPSRSTRPASIADGLMTIRPGDLTFEHVRAVRRRGRDRAGRRDHRAIAWLFRHARLVVEPSGADDDGGRHARPWAASIRARGPVVAIVSGGNVEPEQVRTLHQPVKKDSSLSRVQLVARIRESLVQQSAPRVWLGRSS